MHLGCQFASEHVSKRIRSHTLQLSFMDVVTSGSLANYKSRVEVNLISRLRP